MIDAIIDFCAKNRFSLEHARIMADIWADDVAFWDARTLRALSDAATGQGA